MAMNVCMSHKYDDNDDNDGNDDHDDYDDYHYCNCYQQTLVVRIIFILIIISASYSDYRWSKA